MHSQHAQSNPATQIVSQAVVQKADIIEGLRTLGLSKAASVIVHSSLSSFGQVKGGALAVIEALQEVIGERGNLMFPTFSFSSNEYFEVESSPSRTGRITEVARKLNTAKRSWSPTHSVVVIGPDADQLIGDHMNRSPVGIDSPIDRLSKMGGQILLLGVGLNSVTAIHTGESYANMPYLRAPRLESLPKQAIVKTPEGSEVVVVHTEMPGCSEGFSRLSGPLAERDIVRETVIGQAKCQLMSAQAIISVTQELLSIEPDALLCPSPQCGRCCESRVRLNAAGLLEPASG